MVRPLANDRKADRLARSIVAIALVVGGFACARAGRGATGPDAERQSDAEYDVARDLFMRARDPRGALAHAEKAIELNEQNADAHHFVALIYLSFCAASPLECRLSEAEKSARRAIEIKTDNPECRSLQDAFEARARVYSKSKNCDLAKGDLERCREISADSPAGQRCVASLKSSPC